MIDRGMDVLPCTCKAFYYFRKPRQHLHGFQHGQCIERENEGSVDEVRDGEEDDEKCCGVASKPLVSAEYQ